MARVAVVLPCRNEARNLEVILPLLPSWIDQVVVVDSGSTDDTVAVARRLVPDALVVTAPRPGKGCALETGLAAADADYVIAMDADGSNDPAEIERIVVALDAGADLVKGSRYLPGGGSDDVTPFRNFGNLVLCSAFNRLHGSDLTDLCYGYVGIRSDRRAGLLDGCDGFDVEAVIQANAARAGLRVEEVPSVEAKRIHGSSNLHPVRDGARILSAIVRTRPQRGAAAARA